ncbi:CPBP family intramembrane metalloprotease [Rhodococcus fascians]|nr:CPBP family intramembrane metalloprotease [Rhodococcus fascians]
MDHSPDENAPLVHVNDKTVPGVTGSPLPIPTVSDVASAFLGGFGGTAIGGLLGAAVGFMIGEVAEAALLATILAGMCGCAGLYFALIRRRRWSLSDLGFRSPAHSLLHLLWQVPLLMAFAVLATAGIGALLDVTPDGNQNAIVKDAAQIGPTSIAAIIVLIAGVVPLIEEIVFRRVLLDWLMSKMPTAVSAALVTIAFALCHVAPPAMLYILSLGTGLVALRLWYRSLWAPLILHACNNAVVSSIAIAVVVT